MTDRLAVSPYIIDDSTGRCFNVINKNKIYTGRPSNMDFVAMIIFFSDSIKFEVTYMARKIVVSVEMLVI